MKKEDAARKANYSRSAYYKHIKNPGLDYHILIDYGKAIKHDFTEDFPDMPKYLLEDPEEEIHNTPKTFEEAVKLMEMWKRKYVELIDRHTRLLEERRMKQAENK